METLNWSRLLAGAVACGEEPMQEQVFWQDLCPSGDPCWSSLFLMDRTPWKGSILEQFLKSCSPCEAPILEKFAKDCTLWEAPNDGTGEQHEEEGVAEMKCYALTTTPILQPPVLLRRKEVEE
ncbi:hypothetical protein llap_9744 [Limosa lapponica baueri]|uniref:Uncharacterized protein n=1 Tax=Limosa lapponica baueri TaxID=1758121 RepID=A0A2I0U1K6_LIMLA|nr:hypothetical protein llap_9744 [Limosa lapponica baueri]